MANPDIKDKETKTGDRKDLDLTKEQRKLKELEEAKKNYNKNVEKTTHEIGGEVGDVRKEMDKLTESLHGFKNDIWDPGVEKLRSNGEDIENIQNLWKDVEDNYTQFIVKEDYDDGSYEYKLSLDKFIDFAKALEESKKEAFITVLQATINANRDNENEVGNDRVYYLLNGVSETNQ